ncbi:winged helix-turn-helix transcriptional regulator [Staphylococcus xylosus]|uniref:winged helix-turn-helix transcriptional regulator n=1 Tax=Staphylococcus xylosus TaxID=1288 RepID=UPI000D1DB803|nr:helix-turn-helix domain-containing protein [Staphylococcus xylosus]MBF0813732.1 helix-turn-helix transcriptional regulator [Staphylococcus saprophyticus]NQD99566.1 helix-turn-helix transcriptional regulator [Staphylococcus xylosus]PTI04265.1 transcriptional regulator [Staphylococcus xylosus]TFV23681.1 transcriptional regulator [Staphylococcus saprophyticus]
MDKNELIKKEELKNTGVAYTLSLIGGKYKMVVLYALYLNEKPIRYNELKRKIDTVSFKTLTNTLRELEKDGLIYRKEYPQIPPKVEYRLSEKGSSIIPVLDKICEWGERQMKHENRM